MSTLHITVPSTDKGESIVQTVADGYRSLLVELGAGEGVEVVATYRIECDSCGAAAIPAASMSAARESTPAGWTHVANGLDFCPDCVEARA